MNPEAVEALAKFKLPNAKVVWMPIFDSRAVVEGSGEKRNFVVVSEGGKLTKDTLAILDSVAKNGFSLGTSHLGADEALLVVRAARERGIPVSVTHAAQKPVSMTIVQMKEAAKMGAYIEHTALGDWMGPDSKFLTKFYQDQHRVKIEEVVQAIKEVGVEHSILATDMGQAYTPDPPDGFKWFILSLKKQGITDQEIDTMARKNPAKFLKLREG